MITCILNNMKKTHFIILVLCYLFITSCSTKKEDGKLSPEIVSNPATASGSKDEKAMPEFKFEVTRHHFGDMKEGEVVSFSFPFKNVGEADLVIMDVATSCGCTSPFWPKDPIKPGQESKIDVTFNSAGKSGMVSKTITVFTNAVPSSRVLTISAEVNSK